MCILTSENQTKNMRGKKNSDIDREKTQSNKTRTCELAMLLAIGIYNVPKH